MKLLPELITPGILTHDMPFWLKKKCMSITKLIIINLIDSLLNLIIVFSVYLAGEDVNKTSTI